jgi:rod shape-determining protein MreD
MNESGLVGIKLPFAMVLVLLLQSSLLSEMRLGVVRPDAMILLPIAAGVLGGSERGAVVGFFAGMLSDLFLQTPMGLSALTYSVVGFGVGATHTGVLRAAWWIGPLTAAAASAISVVLFVTIGAVVGVAHLFRPGLGWIIVGVALINAPLSIAVTRLMAWAWPVDTNRAFAR